MRRDKLKRNQGSIFIVVMAVVGAMAVISAGMVYAVRVEGKMCGMYISKAERFYLAAGVIERAKAAIAECDDIKKLTKVCGMEADAKEEGLVDSMGVLNYQVVDEYSMLSLNSSDTSEWGEMESVGSEFAAVAADWADGDDIRNNEGAEIENYVEFGYAAKNKPVEMVREMMFFKGVDVEQYQTLLRLFTVWGDGRVNINTVSSEVLSSFGGIDERVGEIIESYRNESNENVIEDSEEILKISGLSELEVELLGQYCRYETDMFRVFVEVAKDNGKDKFMGTIRKNADKCEIVSFELLIK